ncbi:hypothetical protein BIU88_03675 [Chlorobaculum limnaeum]|uniref:Uncharacterized protein n=1 Tax=Chlorobaculum limnaeum TaxID=274537 RepID=A0A1D8CYX4_CHLLM|nr:hypothetical protein BIU88_03675 [Chlorobaculum limnaeum]
MARFRERMTGVVRERFSGGSRRIVRLYLCILLFRLFFRLILPEFLEHPVNLVEKTEAQVERLFYHETQVLTHGSAISVRLPDRSI